MATAVIDIGTNTILLLIVERDGDGALQPRLDLTRFARLGQGLDTSGVLSAAAIERGLEVCREYRRVLDAHDIAVPVVVGTQALREASNRAELIAPAAAILRASIDVISGEREAQLAFASVAQTFPELAGTFLVVDVGGGSTEIIVGEPAGIVRATSIPIGAVRLGERHLAHDPPSPTEARALFADIDAQLASLDLPRGVPIIATAGTATTLAALALRMTTYDPVKATGYRMTAMAIESQLARLLTANLAARQALRGMEAGRADVIAAGVAILARLMARTESPTLIVADRGVRWGLAFELASSA